MKMSLGLATRQRVMWCDSREGECVRTQEGSVWRNQSIESSLLVQMHRSMHFFVFVWLTTRSSSQQYLCSGTMPTNYILHSRALIQILSISVYSYPVAAASSNSFWTESFSSVSLLWMWICRMHRHVTLRFTSGQFSLEFFFVSDSLDCLNFNISRPIVIGLWCMAILWLHLLWLRS